MSANARATITPARSRSTDALVIIAATSHTFGIVFNAYGATKRKAPGRAPPIPSFEASCGHDQHDRTDGLPIVTSEGVWI